MSATSKDHRAIVITDASSGIGRATAVAFAARGDRLILAARDRSTLETVAAECIELGASVEFLSTDVSDERQVDDLASLAVTAFGRIDLWINCAAVLAFGPFSELPADMFRRVIDVNLMGTVHGSRAAIKTFQKQNNRGTLVNVGSMLSMFAEPYLSAYVASKFAIRGFSAGLRQELAHHPDIHVCTVLPVAIDTPIYQKAANVMGRPVRSIVPLYRTQVVARTIVGLAVRPRAETIAGGYGYLLDILNRTSPHLMSYVSSWLAPKLQFEQGSAVKTAGNVFISHGPRTIDGGWRHYWKERLRVYR